MSEDYPGGTIPSSQREICRNFYINKDALNRSERFNIKEHCNCIVYIRVGDNDKVEGKELSYAFLSPFLSVYAKPPLRKLLIFTLQVENDWFGRGQNLAARKIHEQRSEFHYNVATIYSPDDQRFLHIR